jgi:hypothetical protein
VLDFHSFRAECSLYLTLISDYFRIMQTLRIEGTKYTPKVVLDPQTRRFEISGRSLPEDTEHFFRPILDWLKEYSSKPQGQTELVFDLEYFNTGSSRAIMEILIAMKEVTNAKIVWNFKQDDDDMQEAGEQFAQIVEMPFELKGT